MKKKVILCIIVCIIIMIISGVYMYYTTIKKPEKELLEPIGTEPIKEEIFAPGEVDEVMPIISFSNKSDFSEECSSLPRYAKLGFEDFIVMYLDYYLEIPKDVTYTVDYVKGSFKDDVNLPYFLVGVNLSSSECVYVECYYNKTYDIYVFESEINQ